MRTIKGFSPIELDVVIAIILIIMGIAIPRVTKGKILARETGAIKAITTDPNRASAVSIAQFACCHLFLCPGPLATRSAGWREAIPAGVAGSARVGWQFVPSLPR